MTKATLRNKLECSVCLELFKTPKFLPCHHTFCQKCLEDLASKSPTRGSFQCPTCRRDTAVPKGGVLTFQENFYLTDELEEVRKSGDRERCTLHQDQAVSLLCKDCDIPICQTCKTTRHDQHNTALISEETIAAKKELKRFLAELDERAVAVEATLSRISREDKDVERKTKELKKNVEEKTNAWIAKLTAARNVALKSVNDIAAKRQAETGQTILRCQKEQKKTTILKEQAKNALMGGRGVILFTVRDKIRKLLQNTQMSRYPELASFAIHDTRVNTVDVAICSLSLHVFLSTPSGAMGCVDYPLSTEEFNTHTNYLECTVDESCTSRGFHEKADFTEGIAVALNDSPSNQDISDYWVQVPCKEEPYIPVASYTKRKSSCDQKGKK